MTRNLTLTNRTKYPNNIVEKIIVYTIEEFHDIYQKQDCDIEIIICETTEDFDTISQKYMAEKIKKDFRDYDGRFICPQSPGETFRIIFILKVEDIPGMEQYVSEQDTGSLRDVDLPAEERERRGLALMGFFHFVETLLHEYSHLCSFEQYMQVTDWEDPAIGAHSIDYHLQDEFIARYRSTMAVLKMIEPFAESDLLYSLWLSYWNGAKRAYSHETETMQAIIDNQRAGIEQELGSMILLMNLSFEDLSAELEMELGHKLKNPASRPIQESPSCQTRKS